MDSTDGPFMYLVFNGATGPFKDARVRQAVAFAIKREDVAKAAFYGHAATLGGMPIPAIARTTTINWRITGLRSARAKQLLAEAGVGAGSPAPLLSNITTAAQIDRRSVQQNLAISHQCQLALPDWANFSHWPIAASTSSLSMGQHRQQRSG